MRERAQEDGSRTVHDGTTPRHKSKDHTPKYLFLFFSFSFSHSRQRSGNTRNTWCLSPSAPPLSLPISGDRGTVQNTAHRHSLPSCAKPTRTCRAHQIGFFNLVEVEDGYLAVSFPRPLMVGLMSRGQPPCCISIKSPTAAQQLPSGRTCVLGWKQQLAEGQPSSANMMWAGKQ